MVPLAFAGFDLLDFSDQSCLLSFASLEVTFLLSAQHFGQNPTTSSPGRQNQRSPLPLVSHGFHPQVHKKKQRNIYVLPALQLFNLSTHACLRNAGSKEHSRTSDSPGKPDCFSIRYKTFPPCKNQPSFHCLQEAAARISSHRCLTSSRVWRRCA